MTLKKILTKLKKVQNTRAVNLALLLHLFFIIVYPYSTLAQYAIEKIENNGIDANRMVWVIMGDGYTSFQMDDFYQDVDHIVNEFFSVSPWAEYRNFFNIYRIDVTSNESGADYPSNNEYVDTALDATYDAYGIWGLLAANDLKALDVASQVPTFDAVMVVVNDERYGGSSGSTMVLSNHYESVRIALHEFGHFIGGLADEYEESYPGYPEGDNEPNVTYQMELANIPWKDWIVPGTPLPTPEYDGDFEIGLFEGARYKSTGIFRPTYNSIMRSLNAPYGPINREALIINLHDYVDIIDTSVPNESVVVISKASNDIQCALELILPTNENIEVKWEVDGVIQEGENTTLLNVDTSTLKQGNHTVKVVVTEDTLLVKNDPQGLLSSSRTWIIEKETTNGAIKGRVANILNSRGIKGVLIKTEDGKHSTITGEDGSFGLSPVDEGLHSIITQSERYDTDLTSTIRVVDGKISRATIFLTPLFESHSISGQILGKIKEGIQIDLQRGGEIFLSSITDANGRYSFNGLESGYYSVIPDYNQFVFTPPLHSLILEDTSITNIDFYTLAAFCPAQMVLNNDIPTVALLRQVRDEVLVKHGLGRQYINLYYRYAPELTRMILEHPEIEKNTRELIEDLVPDMRALIEGKGVFIETHILDKLIDFIDTLVSYASPRLKKSLSMLRKNIENETLLHAWGVKSSES